MQRKLHVLLCAKSNSFIIARSLIKCKLEKQIMLSAEFAQIYQLKQRNMDILQTKTPTEDLSGKFLSVGLNISFMAGICRSGVDT